MATRRLTPRDIRIAVLNWNGKDPAEIANSLGVSEAYVDTRLRSRELQEFTERLANKSIDTMVETQADLQSYAPLALHEQANLMLNSRHDGIRLSASRTILEMAGHTPTRHVQIERIDAGNQRYEDMTPEEIARNIKKSITPEKELEVSDEETLH